jgi:STE24 endopeptidase
VSTLAVVVVVALLADFLLQSTADYLNVRRSRMPVPRVLDGLYDDATRDRAVRHLSANTGVGLVERAVLLICLLAFWLLGGFGFVDELVRGYFSGVVSRGLAYVGLLGVG